MYDDRLIDNEAILFREGMIVHKPWLPPSRCLAVVLYLELIDSKPTNLLLLACLYSRPLYMISQETPQDASLFCPLSTARTISGSINPAQSAAMIVGLHREQSREVV